MNSDEIKLERLRNYLARFPICFFLVYRVVLSETGAELKWFRGLSSDKKTNDEYNELAIQFEEVAAHCYQNNRNLILRESPSSSRSSTKNWCGLKVRNETEHVSSPPNAYGLWHVVVGSGAVRAAGFVIAARLSAKHEKELVNYIVEIQEILK